MVDVSVDSSFASALECYQQGAFEESLVLLKSIVESDSSHVQAWSLWAMIAVRQQDWAVAYSAYQQVITILSPITPEIYYNLALACGQLGRTDEAKEYFSAITAQSSLYHQARYQLGLLYLAEQSWQQAALCLEPLIEQMPNHAGLWVALGSLALGQADYHKALTYYDQANKIKPGNEDASNNSGLAYFRLGRVDEARAAFEQTLQNNPNHLGAYCNLGLLHQSVGNWEAARQTFEALTRVSPNSAEGYFSLANAYRALDSIEEAVKAYQKALGLQPGHAQGWNDLGLVYMKAGNLDKSREAFSRALAINESYHSARVNLGNWLRRVGRFDEAVETYRHVISADPSNIIALEALGLLQAERGFWDEAQACFEQLITVSPESDGTRIRLAMRLEPVYQSQAEMDSARQKMLEQFSTFDPKSMRVDNPLTEIGLTPFYLAYHGRDNVELTSTLGRFFYELLNQNPPESFPPRLSLKPRVGFVSKFFRSDHTMGRLYHGLIQKLSREKFDVVVFTVDTPCPLDITAPFTHVRLNGDEWHQSHARILAQDIDLLYFTDVAMEPFSYFLSFKRLAPVQCVTWGHPESTGSPAMDYFISSVLFEPPDNQAHYTESLVRLEGLTHYFSPPTLEPMTREALGLPSDATLYVCPQTMFKFHPDFDEVLVSILTQDPRAHLVWVNPHELHWQEALLTRLSSHMPDVRERVSVLPRLSREAYLNVFFLADVVLDTPHFCGGNSSLEALSMGKPIVTWPTPYLRARLTTGFYEAMGLTELIVDSAQAYSTLALRLGTDPSYRETICNKILAQRACLFNHESSLRALEDFLMTAIHQSRRQPPLPQE